MVEPDAEKVAAVDRLPLPERVQPAIVRVTTLLLLWVKVIVVPEPENVVMPTASPKVDVMVTIFGTWLQLAVPVHCPPEHGYDPMGHVLVEGASHCPSVVL
jgi:hypothetical protein